jgi:DNA-binding Lrp family transcriptional regulator
VAKGKEKSGRLQVFKGREAKLNRAIFHILALKGPQTIYEISKEVKTQKGLKNTKYTNVNRRVRTLEESGYLEKAGIRSTQAGGQATLYQLTTRAHVALLLSQISPDTFTKEADEDALIAELAALILFLEKRERARNANEPKEHPKSGIKPIDH